MLEVVPVPRSLTLDGDLSLVEPDLDAEEAMFLKELPRPSLAEGSGALSGSRTYSFAYTKLILG